MLTIMTTGRPVTGRTTTAKTLADYFSQYTQVEVVSKKTGEKLDMSKIILDVYKLASKELTDVLIIDGIMMNTFDRGELINAINDATDSENDFIAIHHERSYGFVKAHNEDAGHQPYAKKVMFALNSIEQQPIRQEGIDMIHHVRYDRYIDMNKFISTMNDIIGTSYPVPPAEEEAENGQHQE